MEWFESLVLGVVQGLTEFLPVSSDGHLTITQKAFEWINGSGHTGAENLFFDIMLHVGTVGAILAFYRAVIKTGARGLSGAADVPPSYQRAALIRTGVLVFLATLPLAPYAKYKHLLEELLERHGWTASGVGFLITAGALLVTVWLSRRDEGGKGPAETTYLDALLIGLAQMFAPLPGVSRSGLTIAAALALGLSRSWAVGFSLLIAVPAILGATVFELKGLDPATLDFDRVARTVAATVVAGLVGYGAILWLVRIVRAGRLWYFSVYLVVLAVIVLTVAALSGGPAHVSRQTLDRPVRTGVARPGAR